jgi:hypothetical protein
MLVISAGRRIIMIVLVCRHGITEPDRQSELADGWRARPR